MDNISESFSEEKWMSWALENDFQRKYKVAIKVTKNGKAECKIEKVRFCLSSNGGPVLFYSALGMVSYQSNYNIIHRGSSLTLQ